MTKEIVLAKIYVKDRNFLESLKRRLRKKSIADTLETILKTFRRTKLHLDLEVESGRKNKEKS